MPTHPQASPQLTLLRLVILGGGRSEMEHAALQAPKSQGLVPAPLMLLSGRASSFLPGLCFLMRQTCAHGAHCLAPNTHPINITYYHLQNESPPAPVLCTPPGPPWPLLCSVSHGSVSPPDGELSKGGVHVNICNPRPRTAPGVHAQKSLQSRDETPGPSQL